jgi:hypothetical protein
MKNSFLFLVASCVVLSQPALAAQPSSPATLPSPFDPIVQSEIYKAFAKGTPWIDMRYRYENVMQDGMPHQAHANTLRTRLGYKTGVFHGFHAGIEVQNNTVLGSESFNDTINGKTTIPTVADPQEDLQLSQAYFKWEGLPDTSFNFGRQVINLDNQRWVGRVDWRQLGQTFDSVGVSTKSIPNAELSYSYVFHVNRIFGTRSAAGIWDTNTHLFNGNYQLFDWLKIVGYGYLLDINESAANSSATFGLRMEGKHPLGSDFSALYAGEYARQSDHANNTANYGLNYYMVEPGLNWKQQLTGKIGFEVLEGNGTSAVQAPLGTLHAFNGWADKFLTTPTGGLEDFYASASYTMKGVHDLLDGTTFQGIWHRFNANNSSLHYGDEWNFQVSQTFFGHYTLGLKYADYQADDLFTDTRKLIATVQMKY